MKNEMALWRDTENMEEEEEFANLSDPVSLLNPMNSALEVMDLLSTSTEQRPPLEVRFDIFPIAGFGWYTTYKPSPRHSKTFKTFKTKDFIGFHF